MAKRRAEDTLLHDSPSKRCYRSLCCVDLQLESEAPSGGVSPPSLLALLGSRCRKRPYCFEDPEKQEEAALFRTTTNCDTRRLQPCLYPCSNKTGVDLNISGSLFCLCPSFQSDGDTNTDDCTYNSFQYWRVPLPELDLSLLEDTGDHSQSKEKLQTKDSSSDAMET
uniref:Putative WW-binding domain-containing protein n=1 Tax=Amphiprion percula TaxID=161767 RepID=A0A3P8SVE5_AMPPE